jgi:cell division protein FtsQ
MKRFHSRKDRKSPDRQGRWKALFSVRTLTVAALLLGACAVAAGGVWAYRVSARFFLVNEIVFHGNTHLSDGDLKAMTGVNQNEGLLRISAKAISEKLLKSPWIKDVSVRKDLPHAISIQVYEASPFAILETKGRAYLIDEKGRMLEELKGALPFLPVITADPFREHDIFMEAVNLARVLKEKKIATERSRVEIVADKAPESISVVMDNVVIKIGQGDYERKLSRFFELEDEIKKRSIAVDYVDLRFANRVVVKPINEVVR